MSDSPHKPPSPRLPLPVLRWWWVALATVVATVVTLALVMWLIGRIAQQPNSELAKTELEAIRTALTVGVGAGGAFALWLAARRQRSTELQLLENARIAEENKKHGEKVAEITELDSRERRITELYTKAVEQLGSDKAPVRLGGLYALERVANDNPTHRQTVANVICAYLRMPYDPPIPKSGTIDSVAEHNTKDQRRLREELQVRKTAQAILVDRLRRSPKNGPHWGPLDLDLREATLINFRLEGCEVGYVDFAHARFTEVARFLGTNFHDEAWFFKCTFDCMANFSGATFSNRSIFTRTRFEDNLFIQHAKFKGGALFLGVTFKDKADFMGCEFEKDVNFEEIQLLGTLERTEVHRKRFNWPESNFNLSGAEVLDYRNDADRSWPPSWEMQKRPHRTGSLVYVPDQKE